MILYPRPSQRARLHYRASLRSVAPEGAAGVILICGRGPGPRNCLLLADDGRKFVVPKGNLEPVCGKSQVRTSQPGEQLGLLEEYTRWQK